MLFVSFNKINSRSPPSKASYYRKRVKQESEDWDGLGLANSEGKLLYKNTIKTNKPPPTTKKINNIVFHGSSDIYCRYKSLTRPCPDSIATPESLVHSCWPLVNSVRSVCRQREKTMDVTEGRLSAPWALSAPHDLGRRVVMTVRNATGWYLRRGRIKRSQHALVVTEKRAEREKQKER